MERPGTMVKSRRAEHAQDTRSALLAAAEALFGERGYAGTSLDEVARRARVTKGALYHHFASKEDLFRAVVEDLSRGLVDRLAATVLRGGADVPPDGAPDVWDLVRAGYQARLDVVCSDPAFQRIVDRDAGAVLGDGALSEIVQGPANAVLVPVLDEAVAAGVVRPLPVETLARLLGVLVGAASRVVAAAEDKDRARAEVGEVLDALLEGLRRPA